MRIAVVGTGMIGTYVAGKLIHAGEDVTMVGREWVRETISLHGLVISDKSTKFTILAEKVSFQTHMSGLADIDVFLVAVKSKDTQAVGRELSQLNALKEGSLFVSLQNGVRNGALLAQELPSHCNVLKGMVGFNVALTASKSFHCGASGPLVIQQDVQARQERIVKALQKAGLNASAHPNIEGILYGKLLQNLVGVVNALSSVPLLETLRDWNYRQVILASMREALTCMQANNIQPVGLGLMSPTAFLFLFSLPSFILNVFISFSVDASAKSSTLDDLERGRETEIDYLTGEILALATRAGLPAPVNERLYHMVKAAEQNGKPPHLTGPELWRMVCGSQEEAKLGLQSHS